MVQWMYDQCIPHTPTHPHTMPTLFTPHRCASMTSSGSRPSRRSACHPQAASRVQTQACYSGRIPFLGLNLVAPLSLGENA